MEQQVLILGAGFSLHAGLPLQSDFTEALLAARTFADGKPSRVLTDYLCKFVHDSFGHRVDAKACFWPALEDLFTCVDLSANTGHHLGRPYSPAALRTVRRALISRIIRMLREKYAKSEKKPDERRERLVQLLSNLDLQHTSFVNLNWDVALEQTLSETRPEYAIKYGAAERAFDFDDLSKPRPVRAGQVVQLAKIHGSINWLYCDNCRRLYAAPPRQINRIADQLLSGSDWDEIGKVLGRPIDDDLKKSARNCPCCPDVPLGTRIATFSYRKALDFPMFQRTWFTAERLLAHAAKWVFIGYSLPAADFEFKYLLKRVQLARGKQPEFVIVTGGTSKAVRETVENYQQFFGDRIRKDKVFRREIDADAIACITNTLAGT